VKKYKLLAIGVSLTWLAFPVFPPQAPGTCWEKFECCRCRHELWTETPECFILQN